jgi:hypothetical protein
MEETTQSQERAILGHLQQGKSLTQIDALRLFGSFRLGARVYNLRRKGYPIASRIVERNHKRVAEYTFEKN